MVTFLCVLSPLYIFEDGGGTEEEGGHFPDCSFEIHAWEFERAFEHAWHLEV